MFSRREPLAFDLGGHQPADHVVAGIAARFACVERLVEVRLEPLDRFVAELHQLLGSCILRHTDTERHVLEPHEVLEVVDREPEDGEEDRRRERLTPRLVDVDFAVVDEPVDQLVRQLADVVLERRDAPRGEHRVEQPPVLRVLGPVEAERDRLAVAPEVFAGLLDVVAAVDGEDVLHPQQRDGAVRVVDHRARRRALHVHRLGLGARPRRLVRRVAEPSHRRLELLRGFVELGHASPRGVGFA